MPERWLLSPGVRGRVGAIFSHEAARSKKGEQALFAPLAFASKQPKIMEIDRTDPDQSIGAGLLMPS